MSDLGNHQAKVYETIIHDDRLGPGNDACLIEIWKNFNLSDV